jgi:hypothetical protein
MSSIDLEYEMFLLGNEKIEDFYYYKILEDQELEDSEELSNEEHELNNN